MDVLNTRYTRPNKGKRIRIFIGEAEEWQGKPLYRALLEHVQQQGATGATVFRGIEGFGPEHHLSTERLPDIAENLPLIIDIVESSDVGNRISWRVYDVQHHELGGSSTGTWWEYCACFPLSCGEHDAWPARSLRRSGAGMAGVMAAALSTRRRFAAVLVGGFCGAITRYLLSSGLQAWLGKGWPYDILLINITGALLLALVTTLADDTLLIGPTRRLFINVGFLGAYTTFSSLVLGDILLLGQGQWLAALLYLMGSFVGGVLSVWLGDWLGQWYLRVRRRAVMQIKVTSKRTGALGTLARDGSANEDHVDMQDDLLLPDQVDEREIGPHSFRREG